jgi:hypothetical protein
MEDIIIRAYSPPSVDELFFEYRQTKCVSERKALNKKAREVLNSDDYFHYLDLTIHWLMSDEFVPQQYLTFNNQ